MTSYLLRRVALVLPTLVGVSLLAFVLATVAPGDPARDLLARTTDNPQPSVQQVDAMRHELGLDRPLPEQYARWLSRVLVGDLGRSYATRRPVAIELQPRILATLELAVPSALLALAVGVVLGAASALSRRTHYDQAVRIASLAGASMPSFWLAYVLVLVFAVDLHLFPVAGREEPTAFILPVLTLAAAPTAVLARFTRSAVLGVIAEDHVRTARAKGLRERFVIARHALLNASIPILTSFGTTLGHLVAGAVVVETIFAWPGIGKLAVDAILGRDYPVIQAFVLYTGGAFVAINVLVDVAYGFLDPRVRVGASASP